jgi:hypothetical protein
MSLLEGYEDVLKELEGRIRSDFEIVLPDLALDFITYAAWVADDPDLPVEDDIVCVASGSSFPDPDRRRCRKRLLACGVRAPGSGNGRAPAAVARL